MTGDDRPIKLELVNGTIELCLHSTWTVYLLQAFIECNLVLRYVQTEVLIPGPGTRTLVQIQRLNVYLQLNCNFIRRHTMCIKFVSVSTAEPRIEHIEVVPYSDGVDIALICENKNPLLQEQFNLTICSYVTTVKICDAFTVEKVGRVTVRSNIILDYGGPGWKYYVLNMLFNARIIKFVV